MPRLREMIMVLVAGAAMCALAACQNTSGAPDTLPANCAMTGSSCDSGR